MELPENLLTEYYRLKCSFLSIKDKEPKILNHWYDFCYKPRPNPELDAAIRLQNPSKKAHGFNRGMNSKHQLAYSCNIKVLN